MLYYICNHEKITTVNLRSCYNMLKFNVHMIVYNDDEVVKIVMIKRSEN